MYVILLDLFAKIISKPWIDISCFFVICVGGRAHINRICMLTFNYLCLIAHTRDLHRRWSWSPLWNWIQHRCTLLAQQSDSISTDIWQSKMFSIILLCNITWCHTYVVIVLSCVYAWKGLECKYCILTVGRFS